MLFMPYQERDEALVMSWLESEKQFYQWSSGVLGPWPMPAGTLNAFYKAIKSKGVRVKDIAFVLATHYHPDHIGLIPT